MKFCSKQFTDHVLYDKINLFTSFLSSILVTLQNGQPRNGTKHYPWSRRCHPVSNFVWWTIKFSKKCWMSWVKSNHGAKIKLMFWWTKPKMSSEKVLYYYSLTQRIPSTKISSISKLKLFFVLKNRRFLSTLCGNFTVLWTVYVRLFIWNSLFIDLLDISSWDSKIVHKIGSIFTSLTSEDIPKMSKQFFENLNVDFLDGKNFSSSLKKLMSKQFLKVCFY